MRKIMSPFIALTFLGLASLGACNTVEGVGEDVEAAGAAIEEEAEEAQDDPEA